ncbi:MAG: glycosyltransferase family 2 protein, partial [Hyphomicrobiales bacterium]
MTGRFRELLLRGTGGRIRDALPLGSRPTVSVVIPCYNYGRYLPQCVYSVSRNQPGIELEIIIVDDASTDNSADVARQLAAEDDRIILIRHAANAGHIATYNDGLAAATGDYVLLLSADDLATPGALTRAVALFEAEPSVGLVYGRAVDFSGQPPSPRTVPSRWVVWNGVDWLRERCRVGFNVVASPEVMMRMSVLRGIGPYSSELPHAGDFEMWLRTACVSGVGFLLDVDQAFYRKHPQNMHRRQFAATTHRGQLIDLRQRWQSFLSVFDGAGQNLVERDALLAIARRTLRGQARDLVTYARARGFRDFPYDDFDGFIRELDGQLRRGAAG